MVSKNQPKKRHFEYRILGTRYGAPPPLVVILGPTASGKSDMAMKLAKQFNGEIIAADSRTVYKGLDIGTAKPSKADQKQVKHHLIDIVEPNQRFTVADFQRLANIAIKDITQRGKLPIMAGGTGLYIDSVIFNYKFRKTSMNRRKKLERMSKSELTELVGNKADLIDVDNPRRIIRFLESGEVRSSDKQLRLNTLILGLNPLAETLSRRIKQRADQMFKDGVVEEAKNVASKYGWDNEAMRGIIYKLVNNYLEGGLSLEEIKNMVVVRDRQYVKRQRTWFQRNPHIIWVQSVNQAEKRVKKFIDSQKI